MELSPQLALAALGAGGAISTAIWQAGMHIGRLTVRVERIEQSFTEHDRRISEHDRRLSNVRGQV